jgi:Dna[CI] antecedent, DciA
MEAVRTGLRHIMQDLLRARPAEEAVILAWPLVCGKEVAARTQAVSFHEGSLLVEVPDTTWRNQLKSFASRYISSYESLLGSVVKDMHFTIRRSSTRP